jgi:hypothetical protein
MNNLAILIGYEDFDQFVNEVVIDALDMYAEGRADLHDINWGFKTKKEGERTGKGSAMTSQCHR